MEVMLALLMPVAMLTVVGVTIYSAIRNRRSTLEVWSQVAARLGLSMNGPVTWGGLPSMMGNVGNIGVRFYQERVQTGKNSTIHTWLVLHPSPALPPNASLSIDSLWSGLKKSLKVIDDFEIGERAFDQRYVIDADGFDALSLLGGPSRDAASELLEGGASIGDGRISMRVTRGLRDAAYLEALIRASVQRAATLVEPLTLPPGERLERVARYDGAAGVRLVALKALVERQASSVPCQRALDHAVQDPDDHVSIWAAGRVSSASCDALIGVAINTDRTPEARAAAIGGLVRVAPEHADLPAIARAAWRSASDVLRAAAVIAAARAGLADASDWIAVASASGSSTLRRAAAAAAGRRALSGTEDVLIALLDDESEEVLDAAIASLGLVGSVRAVEPLLKHTSGVLRDRARRAAARGAIVAIQARAGHVNAGGLAVVASSGGEVAVVAEVGAAVSAAEVDEYADAEAEETQSARR